MSCKYYDKEYIAIYIHDFSNSTKKEILKILEKQFPKIKGYEMISSLTMFHDKKQGPKGKR